MLFLVTASFLLSRPTVQTYLGEKVTAILKDTYDVHIAVEKMEISFLGELNLDGILIKDHHNDTLITVRRLESSLNDIRSLLNNKLALNDVVLYDGILTMKTYKGEDTNSLTVFSRKFARDKKTKKKPFLLDANNIRLNGITYELLDENRKTEQLVVYYKNIIGDINDFSLVGSSVSAAVSNIELIDNNGLVANNLTVDFSYTPSQMKFKKVVLETDYSQLNFDMVFDYTSDDLKDFNNKVLIDANVHDSFISLIDLKKLYKEFGGEEQLFFSSGFKGSLNDFKLTHLDLYSNTNLKVKGNYHFVNAIDRKKGFVLNGMSDELTSNYAQVKKLLPNLIGKNLPSEFKKIGNFTINGATLITNTKLEIDIAIKSMIGKAKVDLELTNIDNIDEAAYEGNVRVSNLEFGKLLNDANVGKLSFEGKVKGEGFKLENINTTLIGTVYKHQYKGYTYKNIEVNGVLKNKLFNGDLKVNDPNFKFDFNGLADLSSDVNKFDFKAKVAYADFKQLNLFERDSIAIVRGEIAIDLTGNTIDDIVGTANFKNASYTNERQEIVFDEFTLSSSIENKVKSIQIDSKDIVNGGVKGEFKLTDVHKLVRNAMGSMMTNYKPLKVAENQYLEFDFHIYNQVVSALLPNVQLASSALLKGKVIESNNEVKLLFKTPKMKYNRTYIDSIHLQLDNKNPVLNTNFSIRKIKSPAYTLNDINIYNKTLNDTLFFRSDFTGGAENKERFGMSLYYTIDTLNNSVLGVQKSKVEFKNKEWYFNPLNDKNNKVVFDLRKDEFSFEKFVFVTGDQEIQFEGVLRDSTYKDLSLSFERVNLDAIMPKIDSLSLDGELNGAFRFKQEKGEYNPFGKANIANFSINDALQGDMNMAVEAEDSYEKYKVDFQLHSESYRSLHAHGIVDLEPKQPLIDLIVQLKDFKLNAFSPLGKNVLSKLRGVATGNFEVIGALLNPQMNGQVTLFDAGFNFPYLNVDYGIENGTNVLLKEQSFVFENLEIEDSQFKTKGLMNGQISHSAFKDWQLNLQLKSDKLLVLNTEDGEDVDYYGTGFIQGLANFKGPTNDLRIDVKAKTLAGTKFVIPLSDVKAVENSKLIHFKVDTKETLEDSFFDTEVLIEKLQGISLNFDLDVTTDAEAEVVIDRVSGSSLKGTGTGNLLIEIDTKGTFNMYGDYKIEKGIYNFIYGGIINKPFEVKKGGMVSWEGDPMNANLNLQAVHRVKANPKVLLNDLNTNRKIAVDLITDIKGTLFNSTEEFSIEIPNSSSTVATELAFVLNDNDENTTLRQFFSLLISKSFFNEDNLASNGNSAITGTTSDIISGALSDIFNEEGDKFQIDLGYTSGEKNDVETLNIDNQVDISLKTQINDKILIDGNLGVPVGTKTQSSVIGEVKVEFLVDDDGNLRYTVFNRQNEIQYSEEEGYTQGVGLIYQIDFGNLKEMFSKFGLKRKKRNTFGESEDGTTDDELILVVPSIL